MTVPFGTRGLEFRPVETFELIDTAFRVSDAVTGKPVEKALVRVFLQDAMREQESLLVREPIPGHYTMQHRARPDLHYVIQSKGYNHVYGDLPEQGEGQVIEVALVPGLRSPVLVQDADTLAVIPGATFRNASGDCVATTGAAGEALLEGPRAEGKLRVEAKGFAPRKWYASWYTNNVYMDPQPASENH